jgi:hypothetical protein
VLEGHDGREREAGHGSPEKGDRAGREYRERQGAGAGDEQSLAWEETLRSYKWGLLQTSLKEGGGSSINGVSENWIGKSPGNTC